MSHPSKVKGTRWETEVVRYFAGKIPHQVERRALHGGLDRGDILITGGFGAKFALECKAVVDWSKKLSGFVKEAEQEAMNAGVPYGVCILKRRGKSVQDAYVVLSLKQFTEMCANEKA